MATHGTIEVEIVSASTAIVTLRGEHDLHTRDDIAAALETARICTSIAVDLTTCTFADSSVIRTLTHSARKLSETHDALAVVTALAPSPARRAIEIMGLSGILPLYETLGEALAALAGEPYHRIRAHCETVPEARVRRAL